MKFLRIIIGILLLFLAVIPCSATEEMAERTGRDCSTCHLDPSGGGELTEAGKRYLKKISLVTEDSQEISLPRTWKKRFRLIRLVAGYLHIFTAIFWFGTILYVHIILKPSYAAHGLPRGEVRLGLVSMAIMAVTGVVLTAFRMTTLSSFIETRFGILLLIKIFLFLIMVGSAVFVVAFIGPRLRKKRKDEPLKTHGKFTLDELSAFDGTEGRPSYIAYKDRIYDVSQSQYWEGGKHFVRHEAGKDLTDELIHAPHGEEKILDWPDKGELVISGAQKALPPAEKTFYIIAYLNLGMVILITLILALWRWW